MMIQMSGVRSLAIVSGLSGALCLSTGLAYLTVSPTQLTISALVTLGVLGCCALVAAGLWQARVKVENRRFPMLVLGVTGFGYTVASALGYVGAQIARTNRLEPTALPSALHIAGFAVGLLLCLLVLVDYVRMGSGRLSRPRRGAHESVS